MVNRLADNEKFSVRFSMELPNKVLIDWVTIFICDIFNLSKYGTIAQLVEHRTFNPMVVGSNPTGPTINLFLVSN